MRFKPGDKIVRTKDFGGEFTKGEVYTFVKYAKHDANTLYLRERAFGWNAEKFRKVRSAKTSKLPECKEKIMRPHPDWF